MIKIKSVIFFIVSLLTIPAAFAQDKKDVATEKATFGMGCFWCSEAIFQRLKGVTKVESGYSGGTVKNPTYEDVCTGTTGHAEVVQVTFKPEIISYKDLLEIFWKMHDPTTLNRQGADEGTQYRSAIFYHNAAQKQLAETYKAELNKQKVYPHPIVTEITRFSNFFVAENYHQNYFNLNGSKPYCRMVIQPKVDKLEKVFQQKLKQ
ncbi:peptide-methionine (S)-S-oxide reductase MsrA [Mucilaginibacter sp. PAMB04168]|uniref:peptide-methionine (S)-S-oxide reductase MsrA n=1 Tax=Mucilaginibacter sp. PAMB04168 TaxID=3138567 RepID=UPI0031F69DC1